MEYRTYRLWNTRRTFAYSIDNGGKWEVERETDGQEMFVNGNDYGIAAISSLASKAFIANMTSRHFLTF